MVIRLVMVIINFYGAHYIPDNLLSPLCAQHHIFSTRHHTKQSGKWKSLSHVWALQAPLFMGFPRQEYWSRLPLPSPGDLSDPGIKPVSPAFQADSLPAEPSGKPCASLCVLKIPPKIMMPEWLLIISIIRYKIVTMHTAHIEQNWHKSPCTT